MRQGQTSIEYVLAMVGLMILLIALYEVSVSMNGRLSAMQARMEGTRLAAQMGRALDWAEVMGPGTNVTISFYSFPAQYLFLKGSEIVVQDENNQSVGFGRHLGVVPIRTTRQANETVNVSNTAGDLAITGLGR